MTRAGLTDALAKVEFVGPKGRVKFDENGQNVGHFYITEVIEKDGRFAKRTVGVIRGVAQAPLYRKVFEKK